MSRVLIVDDDAIQASAMASIIASEGYEVVGIAMTAEEAVEMTAQHTPALVIMDVCLRGRRDGIEAAAEIRARHGTPHVFVTAYDDTATRRRASETQPVEYLVKPYRIDTLRRVVAAALGSSVPACGHR